MNALKFNYLNHNNEDHSYTVIPLTIQFSQCKCFPNAPEIEAWNIRALVLERSGTTRNVLRTFALIKIRDVLEVSLETS